MKDFAQLLKLPPSILSAISLGTGMLLFLPPSTLEKLGLKEMPAIWRTITGISFIISTSIVVVCFAIKILQMAKSQIFNIRFKYNFPKTMKNLRQEERRLVALLYRVPNFTSQLPYADGVTMRLRAKGMIQLTSSSSITHGDKMTTLHTITPIAQRYIDNNPEFIKEFSTNDLQNLFQQLNDPFNY